MATGNSFSDWNSPKLSEIRLVKLSVDRLGQYERNGLWVFNCLRGAKFLITSKEGELVVTSSVDLKVQRGRERLVREGKVRMS